MQVKLTPSTSLEVTTSGVPVESEKAFLEEREEGREEEREGEGEEESAGEVLATVMSLLSLNANSPPLATITPSNLAT